MRNPPSVELRPASPWLTRGEAGGGGYRSRQEATKIEPKPRASIRWKMKKE